MHGNELTQIALRDARGLGRAMAELLSGTPTTALFT